MGCDIHVYMEKKQTVNGVKKWTDFNNWNINPYYNSSKYEKDEYIINSIYDGRNYELFGILAGVRCMTDPIVDPRGMPSNVSDYIKKAYDGWGSDAHTPSYFTVRELLDYFKENPTTTYDGMISSVQAKALQNGDKPTSWCGGTTDTSYEYHEWEDESPLKYFIDCIKTRIQEDCWNELTEEDLYEMSDKYRVVFWFDN